MRLIPGGPSSGFSGWVNGRSAGATCWMEAERWETVYLLALVSSELKQRGLTVQSDFQVFPE